MEWACCWWQWQPGTLSPCLMMKSPFAKLTWEMGDVGCGMWGHVTENRLMMKSPFAKLTCMK